MTFDDLNKICVAVMAQQIVFDYFSRALTMIIEPAYGYEKEIEGSRFKLVFEDCVLFCCSNTSQFAGVGTTEFISWGRYNNGACNVESSKEQIYRYLSRTISAGIWNSGFSRGGLSEMGEKYDHYFFQNTMGDALDIISSNVAVTGMVK